MSYGDGLREIQPTSPDRQMPEILDALTAAEGATLPRLGDRLEFIVPHCDPTTNLYDRIYACRGDKVEGVWPVAARREFATLARG